MVGRTGLAAAACAASGAAGCAGGPEQVDQVGAFGLVELEGVGDAVDDAFGDPGGVAAFEPDVVLR